MHEKPEKPHPIQPIITDDNGVHRYQSNAIVRWLLDNGGKTLNDIAVQGFPQADQEQFAQLIGYSVSGASDLSYMSSEVIDASYHMIDTGEPELVARNKVMREKLNRLRRQVLIMSNTIGDSDEEFDNLEDEIPDEIEMEDRKDRFPS